MANSTKFKSRNLWKILFGISLALNLLIIGAIVGTMIRISKGPVTNHRASGLLYMRALNLEDKKLLRQEIFKNKDNRKREVGNEHRAYTSAITILKKHPFDQNAFETLLDEQKKYANSRQRSARIALVEHIGNMTREERMIYAKRLENLINRKRK